jgi:hypothetical protein
VEIRAVELTADQPRPQNPVDRIALETFVNGDKPSRERLASHLELASPLAPASDSNVAVLVSHYNTHFRTGDRPREELGGLAQLATTAS